MIVAGVLHFVNEDFYLKIMPPYLPVHRELPQPHPPIFTQFNKAKNLRFDTLPWGCAVWPPACMSMDLLM